MNTDSLSRLEERIDKAITHIERLTEKNHRLETENRELKEKIERLKKELKSKGETLNRIEDKSTRVSEGVRDKIERLLDRIDNYDKGSL